MAKPDKTPNRPRGPEDRVYAGGNPNFNEANPVREPQVPNQPHLRPQNPKKGGSNDIRPMPPVPAPAPQPFVTPDWLTNALTQNPALLGWIQQNMPVGTQRGRFGGSGFMNGDRPAWWGSFIAQKFPWLSSAGVGRNSPIGLPPGFKGMLGRGAVGYQGGQVPGGRFPMKPNGVPNALAGGFGQGSRFGR